ncbi:MAG: pyridoxal phosphate-dependent aminotransferase [Bacteroidetes bacterium]|jgi:aspartate aminotransferase|nr:pyridoxal phosphate-dependent aminotransferase [Bacteroidota bacterium]MDA0844150.1 pyridoxal phosphate-dependent aminotransferase [Bacteroidota bacterium]
MPKVSRKGQSMPSSPIRKLVPFAEAAKQKGIQVLHLNIGQPDIETPEIALKAIKEINLTTLAYSRTEGSDTHREKVARYYQSFGAPIEANDLVITTGGSEALSFVMASLLDAGDEVIIPEPFYANYNGFALANDVVVKPVTAYLKNNFALPSISDFEAQISSKTKAILICNPSNPTGYVYTKDELSTLAALCIKHDLFIVVDEVYREFVYGEKPFVSILNFPEILQYAVVIDSVSKRYSMCGARIGYVATKNKEVRNCILKFAQARLSPPSLAQIASEAALDTDPAYLKAVNTEYNERRLTLIKGLSAIPGVQVAHPEGAFYCIAELPVNDAEEFAQWLLEKFSDNQQTLMLAPAAGFYATTGLGKKEVRIAYVLNIDLLKRAIELLEIALEQYNKEDNV